MGGVGQAVTAVHSQHVLYAVFVEVLGQRVSQSHRVKTDLDKLSRVDAHQVRLDRVVAKIPQLLPSADVNLRVRRFSRACGGGGGGEDVETQDGDVSGPARKTPALPPARQSI